jgi:RimJ/RimL family protein N-acetyltransferase
MPLFAILAGGVHAVPVPTIPPILSTERLRLRPLSAADGPVLEPMLNDPVVREMFHWSPGKHTSGDKWVAAQLRTQDFDPAVFRNFSWAIVLAGTGAVIGVAQLSNIDFYTGAEPAVFLEVRHRGEGYGREAMAEVVRWGFEDLVPYWARTDDVPDTGDRLGKVTVLVMPHNTESITMLSKTPLIDNGTITVTVVPGGTADVRSFSLTRQQYQELTTGQAGQQQGSVTEPPR